MLAEVMGISSSCPNLKKLAFPPLFVNLAEGMQTFCPSAKNAV
jgi:hypothetical protein